MTSYIKKNINNGKFKSFDDLLKDEMKRDQSFKDEYENFEDEYNLIKEVIRIRKEANLTQKELAEKTGIGQANLSRLENGKLNPSFEFLEKIAKALGKKIKIKFE